MIQSKPELWVPKFNKLRIMLEENILQIESWRKQLEKRTDESQEKIPKLILSDLAIPKENVPSNKEEIRVEKQEKLQEEGRNDQKEFQKTSIKLQVEERGKYALKLEIMEVGLNLDLREVQRNKDERDYVKMSVQKVEKLTNFSGKPEDTYSQKVLNTSFSTQPVLIWRENGLYGRWQRKNFDLAWTDKKPRVKMKTFEEP